MRGTQANTCGSLSLPHFIQVNIGFKFTKRVDPDAYLYALLTGFTGSDKPVPEIHEIPSTPIPSDGPPTFRGPECSWQDGTDLLRLRVATHIAAETATQVTVPLAVQIKLPTNLGANQAALKLSVNNNNARGNTVAPVAAALSPLVSPAGTLSETSLAYDPALGNAIASVSLGFRYNKALAPAAVLEVDLPGFTGPSIGVNELGAAVLTTSPVATLAPEQTTWDGVKLCLVVSTTLPADTAAAATLDGASGIVLPPTLQALQSTLAVLVRDNDAQGNAAAPSPVAESPVVMSAGTLTDTTLDFSAPLLPCVSSQMIIGFTFTQILACELLVPK